MGNSKIQRIKYPGDWIESKRKGRKLSVVTAYDATMARLVQEAGIDALLIGDTLGMVIQGRNSTLAVTLQEMIYHCRLVRRGAPGSFLIGDLPFGSYQISPESGLESAFRLMKEGAVDAVKLEGAETDTLRIIKKLNRSGVPVMGHIGLTPQSYLNLGGFRVQGRSTDAIRSLHEQAGQLEQAGCFAIVLELVTAGAATEITAALTIPTIGIGSGKGTSGQVLVLNDLLGLDPDFQARHVKRYAGLAGTIIEALREYRREVEEGSFPTDEHCFH